MNGFKSSDVGVKQLFKLSLPLMLTWISTTIMMFVDRLFLSMYSLEALGAAVNAGTLAWGFAYGFQLFTEMAQVVVAQYRGANQEDKMIQPVWQMLWLSLASVIFFMPLVFWGANMFFDKGSLQSTYFQYLLVFGPMFGLVGAGSAYFIGKGESKVVTNLAIVGNGVNIILDWILIFGIEGVVPSYGIQGAAIATGIGMSVQALGLIYLFLKRTRFVTFSLSWAAFKPCVRAGLPPALYICTELVGWGLFYTIMAKASPEHILVTGICQCLLPLLAFVGVGLNKSVASKAGYLIGAGELSAMPKLFKSGFIILVGYFTILTAFFYFYPNPVIQLFTIFNKNKTDIETISRLFHTIKLGLLLSCVYLFFGGIRCIAMGVLSAAGDSKFLSVIGTVSVWFLLLLPSYFFILKGHNSVTAAQSILALYGIVGSVMYYLRYKLGSWSKNSLLIEKESLKLIPKD